MTAKTIAKSPEINHFLEVTGHAKMLGESAAFRRTHHRPDALSREVLQAPSVPIPADEKISLSELRYLRLELRRKFSRLGEGQRLTGSVDCCCPRRPQQNTPKAAAQADAARP
jgi:hypothetical protein